MGLTIAQKIIKEHLRSGEMKVGSEISLKIDSPVRADVSTIDIPLTTTPSRGIFSPGFTTIISPILTSSGDTTFTSDSNFKLA